MAPPLRVLGPVLGSVLVLVTAARPASAQDGAPQGGPAAAPNVLVILTDDQGWGDLSLNGNQNLRTPNLDGLARDGASFERFFVCPVCSPTRAEFLTGRYHPRCGVHSTSAGGERLDLDERTVADLFHAAGYATGAFGKWHNGTQHPYHPNARGFDEFYGFCSGHWGDYFAPPLDHNGELVQGEGYLADDFTDKAMAFIEREHRAGRRFFAYLAFNTPHSPMQVPERFYAPLAQRPLRSRHRDPEKEDPAHLRAALAMCENIDWNVGRLLARLGKLGIARETIVVFFCDNGPNGWRFNGGMRGRKGSTDEGGVRSPLFVRWPGAIRAGTRIAELGAAIDLLPTLAGLAGIDPDRRARAGAPAAPLDGVSLAPLLRGERAGARLRERMLFSHWRNRVSVRTATHRLDDRGRLYDMVADPGQRRDLSESQPELAARLRRAVSGFREEVVAELGVDDRPFPVGYGRRTRLPARDARTTGGIRRSNRFPNCSYLLHWKSPGDRITWDAEVGVEGDYEVELYYSCPPGDVGATVELAFAGGSVRGSVGKAHDPPVRGAEHDRVLRQESYVQDFAPLRLGRIHLTRGRGPLVLRALRIPGETVMEFRLLVLTRVAQGR